MITFCLCSSVFLFLRVGAVPASPGQAEPVFQSLFRQPTSSFLFFKIVNQDHLFGILLISQVSRIAYQKYLTELLVSQVSAITPQKSLTVLLISLRMCIL